MTRSHFSDTELYAIADLLRLRLTQDEIANKLGWSKSMVAHACPAARRRWPDSIPVVRGSLVLTVEEDEKREALLLELANLLRDGLSTTQVREKLNIDKRQLRNLMKSCGKRGHEVKYASRVTALRARRGSPVWQIAEALNVGSLIAQQLRRLCWVVGDPVPEPMQRSVWLSQQGRKYGVRPAQIEMWLSKGWNPDSGKPLVHANGKLVSKTLLRRLQQIANQQSKLAREKRREQRKRREAKLAAGGSKVSPKVKAEPPVEAGPAGIEGDVLDLLARAPMPLSVPTIARRMGVDIEAATNAVRELCLLRRVKIAGKGPNGTTYGVMT